MDKVQEALNKIQETWGKVPEFMLGKGSVRRIKVFKDGVHITDCLSQKQVADITGMDREGIKCALRTRCIGRLGGYYIVYADLWDGRTTPRERIKPPGKERNRTKKEYRVYRGDTYIGLFFNYRDLAEELGLSVRSVLNAIVGHKGQKTCKGYRFEVRELD